MCSICGCGGGASPGHERAHPHDGDELHAHDHAHHHDDAHHHGHGAVDARVLQLEQDILQGNNDVAAHVRAHLAADRTLAINVVSSPGAGKTTLLVETLKRLGSDRPVGVIEGDQHTSLDAERIRSTGTPAVQLNTGKGCHLDARGVHDALHDLPPLPGGVLFIENVGNLVCPAGFDLGEAARVLVFSVTEGEDKPLKYADMFATAQLVLLNKCDLLPYLRFDVDRARACIAQVNPDAIVLPISATSGEGMDAWLAWIEARCPPR